jgi:hypothetical protein
MRELDTMNHSRLLGSVLAIACLFAPACSNEDAVLVDDLINPIPLGDEVSLSEDVQPIFTMNCAVAGCHDSFTASSGQVLEEGRLFDAGTGIVGVASQGAPLLLRVQPFDSQASYLIHKLQGTQGNVGGKGDQMPLFGTPLNDKVIQVIRDWIDEGAQNN